MTKLRKRKSLKNILRQLKAYRSQRAKLTWKIRKVKRDLK